MIKLYRFQKSNGEVPFTKWLDSLRDKSIQAIIRTRLQRLVSGNFGARGSVGKEVIELKIYVSSGYRVYYAMPEKNIVILLWGGDKSSQRKDIQRAQEFLLAWKETQHEQI